jgi:hypothetical protein
MWPSPFVLIHLHCNFYSFFGHKIEMICHVSRVATAASNPVSFHKNLLYKTDFTSQPSNKVHLHMHYGLMVSICIISFFKYT